MLAIKTEDLTKYYGKNIGVEGLSITVSRGTIFGFLGANGAGKTTTIRILLGLLKPTNGVVEVLGTNISQLSSYPENLQRKIGFLPGELRLYEDMTGQDFLEYMAGFFDEINKELLEQTLTILDLNKEDLSRKIAQYSRGMKQKLGIVQAIQHDPELIILDEPTEGLDPLIQQKLYNLLNELRAQGKTIFMSSHNLAEVEKVCQKVAIIRKGKLVAVEEVSKLQSRVLYTIELLFSSVEEADTFVLEEAQFIKKEEGKIVFRWKGDFSNLLTKLSSYNLKEFICQKASLEEIFLTYYDDDLDEEDIDE